VDYYGLPSNYWTRQIERIENLRQRISAREQIGSGRVIPEDAGLAIGDGKRMSMAIMFIDICDFSSRPMESIGEQDITLRTLNLFFSEMTKIAEEYDGHVEKNTGDGLMIYFKDGEGNPATNGAIRAVAASLTMQAATTQLINPILAATPTKEIQFRTSIDHGQVTIARLGAARGFTSNVAIGGTANFASKVLKHAGKNEIVIGHAVKVLLPDDWQRQWTELLPLDTGWSYTASGEPCLIYKYKGRWAKVV
jgi:adenylate cyclase